MIRLTRAQVREVDRRTIEEYHMPGIVLMENAADAALIAARTLIPHRIDTAGPVIVVCGGGNNGGDGLGVARKLHDRGVQARIVLTVDPATFRGDALIEWKMVQAWKLPVEPATPRLVRDSTCKLLIDAIFGTGLSRAPTGLQAEIIDAINARSRSTRVLAIDVPSGLDCDTGEPYSPCVKATRTVTFVAEKLGFANPRAAEFTGELIVADIGCPRELVEEVARMSPA